FGRRPANVEEFADILDKQLTLENSDYQAKRSGDIFLSRLELTEATPGQFDRWLASTGKLGGQRKVPRLSNDRKIMDALLNLK
ncbi:MAG: GH3 auxin-responsive promoter family protein, partial [Muribaculaceae bacterium]|nr:GH3 auxin-responsive promoter family protein [Muribaculaceae bacterium]